VCVSGMRRMGSVKSRKVSTQSLQSTASAEDSVLSTFVNVPDETTAPSGGGGLETPCEEGQDTQTELRDAGEELDYCRNMPWIKVHFTYISDLSRDGLALQTGPG